MPKIPTYDSPQVKSQSLPGAFIKTGGVNPGAFGAEQGEQLQQAGKILNVVGDNIEKAREQKAISDGMDAANSLQERSLKKQQELQNRAGKDAVGIQKEFETWHAEQQTELAGGLKDPDAQVLFNRNAQKIKLRDQDWAGGYEKKQGDIYHEVTMKTGIENAQSAALMNPTRDNVSSSVNEIRSYYGELAHRKGFDADWIAANTREAEQKIHKDVLSNAMDQDAVGSVQSYINEFGDSLDPGVRGKAEKWVHNKVIDETAGAYADTLVGSGVSYEDAITGAKEKFSGDDEDKYLAKIRSRYSDESRIKNEQSKALKTELTAEAYKAGGWSNLPKEKIDALAEYDPASALRIQESKEREQENLIKNNGKKTATKTDMDKYIQAVEMIDKNEIVKPEDLEEYAPYLSKGDHKKLIGIVQSERKIPEGEVKKAYKMYLPKDMQDEKKWTPEQYADYSVFWGNANDAVSESGDRKVVNKLAADHHREVLVNGSGYFGTNIGRDSMTLGSAKAEGKTSADIELIGEAPKRNAATAPGFEFERRQQEKAAQPQHKAGTRATQNGITYEYDGESWNPVE